MHLVSAILVTIEKMLHCIHCEYLDTLWLNFLPCLSIALDKVLIFFLLLHENICCGYSLKAHCRGPSNEYPQHVFLWRKKKNIYLIHILSGPMLSQNLNKSFGCLVVSLKGLVEWQIVQTLIRCICPNIWVIWFIWIFQLMLLVCLFPRIWLQLVMDSLSSPIRKRVWCCVGH